MDAKSSSHFEPFSVMPAAANLDSTTPKMAAKPSKLSDFIQMSSSHELAPPRRSA